MKHILAAIDGSKPSYRALEHAVKLSLGLRAKLSILLVRQVIVGRHDVLNALSDPEADAILKRAQALVKARNGPKPTILDINARDVAFTIVEVALRDNVDQIVMGASGISGVKAFLLGSVSTEVLKKSVCPVTIVH